MNLPVLTPCPKCGATVPADAPQGLCPRCLGAINLATQTAVTDAAEDILQRPVPPAELAPHFPLLEVLECRGRGGMGVVYRAQQKSLNRVVALKLLAPERVQDPRFGVRFAREAKALARLNHPNIVTVHDFGEAGGFYYLLMEFVDGVNLRQLLRSRTLTSEEALAIVPPVCDALQYAHDRGIVHRDIKPENLLIDREGRVKIADFGIARMIGESESSTGLTETQPAGTPEYMAPEQREQPQTADHRADIYSLGVVIYELLTGELPKDKIQPPSKKASIDVRLDQVVMRAMAKEPSSRYQHASQVRSELETILLTPSATPCGDSPAGAGGSRTEHIAGTNVPEDSIEAVQPKRSSTMKKLVITALAVAVAGAFALVQHRAEARLRNEIHLLREDVAEAESLREENDRLAGDISHNRSQGESQIVDLHRLRAEVNVLREAAEQFGSTSGPAPVQVIVPAANASGDIVHPESEFTYSPEYGIALRKSISPKLSYAYEMAGRRNNIEAVKSILDEHPAYVNEPVGLTGATMLHTAAFNARREIVQELLRRNANVNAQSLVGHTPLYNAVDRGTKDIVLLLIQHGADVSIPAANGVTPLQRALEAGRQEVAEILRAAGARE